MADTGFLDGNVCYHARLGLKRDIRKLFSQDRDYEYFLRLLKRYKPLYEVRLLAFCLFADSAHFIVHSGNQEQIRSFFHRLQESYQIYVCSHRIGSSPWEWQPARLTEIRDDEYLFHWIKTLEFLPVVSSSVKNPVEYPWSSCSYRIFDKTDGLVDKEVNVQEI